MVNAKFQTNQEIHHLMGIAKEWSSNDQWCLQVRVEKEPPAPPRSKPSQYLLSTKSPNHVDFEHEPSQQ
jgi:hypothetical protein